MSIEKERRSIVPSQEGDKKLSEMTLAEMLEETQSILAERVWNKQKQAEYMREYRRKNPEYREKCKEYVRKSKEVVSNKDQGSKVENGNK